ncbi:MAG: type transport system permease protein, partial [Actinomycetota bacterium]|nr:type transport system permease protein [Actinomycetota bacterium]
VIQETTSGVSNIMVAMCPPRRFVVGKTLGIGVMGVVQALAASVPATALLLSRTAKPPFSAWTVAGALMWFALAYALYGHLFTALAAKGRRIEKVAGTTVWVTIPLAIFSFGGVLLAFSAPNAPVTAVASFLPVTAPFAMPVRSAATTLGWWEVPVAALATALGAVAVARWSAWLYVRGLARQ